MIGQFSFFFINIPLRKVSKTWVIIVTFLSESISQSLLKNIGQIDWSVFNFSINIPFGKVSLKTLFSKHQKSAKSSMVDTAFFVDFGNFSNHYIEIFSESILQSLLQNIGFWLGQIDWSVFNFSIIIPLWKVSKPLFSKTSKFNQIVHGWYSVFCWFLRFFESSYCHFCPKVYRGVYWKTLGFGWVKLIDQFSIFQSIYPLEKYQKHCFQKHQKFNPLWKISKPTISKTLKNQPHQSCLIQGFFLRFFESSNCKQYIVVRMLVPFCSNFEICIFVSMCGLFWVLKHWLHVTVLYGEYVESWELLFPCCAWKNDSLNVHWISYFLNWAFLSSAGLFTHVENIKPYCFNIALYPEALKIVTLLFW